MVDADGYIRTVKYTADPKEGFKAEVIINPPNKQKKRVANSEIKIDGE